MAGSADTRSDRERPKASSGRLAPHLDLEIECDRPLAGPARYRLADTTKVRLGRGEQRSTSVGDQGLLSIEIPDDWMSARHAQLNRDESGWNLVATVDKASSSVLHGSREISPDLRYTISGGDGAWRLEPLPDDTPPAESLARILRESGLAMRGVELVYATPAP